MSAAILAGYDDRAMAVAMEHVSWCLQSGHGLRRIAKSVGVDPDSIESIDDVLFAVAGAWLQIDRPMDEAA